MSFWGLSFSVLAVFVLLFMGGSRALRSCLHLRYMWFDVIRPKCHRHSSKMRTFSWFCSFRPPLDVNRFWIELLISDVCVFFFCLGGNGFFYEALLRLQVLLISCQNDLVVFFFFSRISFNYSQTLDAICIWVFIHRMRDRKWVKLIRLTTINRKRKRERRVGEKRDFEKRNKQS